MNKDRNARYQRFLPDLGNVGIIHVNKEERARTTNSVGTRCMLRKTYRALGPEIISMRPYLAARTGVAITYDKKSKRSRASGLPR